MIDGHPFKNLELLSSPSDVLQACTNDISGCERSFSRFESILRPISNINIRAIKRNNAYTI